MFEPHEFINRNAMKNHITNFAFLSSILLMLISCSSNPTSVTETDFLYYKRLKITPYLTNEPIPQGTKLYNGIENGFPVMPDGWVSYKSNASDETFEIYGGQFGRMELTSADFYQYHNYFYTTAPFIAPYVSYEPIFELSEGDIWKFDAERQFFNSGRVLSVKYGLTWRFDEIIATESGFRYIVSENAFGDGWYFDGTPFDTTTTVVIDEDKLGVWHLSQGSKYSMRLSKYGEYFTESPTNMPQQSIKVVNKDGSDYNTIVGFIGRLGPTNVESYESVFNNHRFKINSNGIVSNAHTSSGGGNNFSTVKVTRVFD
jgi:hypothetical protein